MSETRPETAAEETTPTVDATEGATPAVETTPTEGTTPPSETRPRRKRQPKATPEPQMVLEDIDPQPTPAGNGKPATTTRRRSGKGATVVDIANSFSLAILLATKFADPLLPYGGGGLWALQEAEAKAITEPLARIAHRHGLGEVVNPDVLDAGLALQALGVAIYSRYKAIQDHNAAAAAAAAAQQGGPDLAPTPATVDDVEAVLKTAREQSTTTGMV